MNFGRELRIGEINDWEKDEHFDPIPWGSVPVFIQTEIDEIWSFDVKSNANLNVLKILFRRELI